MSILNLRTEQIVRMLQLFWAKTGAEKLPLPKPFSGACTAKLHHAVGEISKRTDRTGTADNQPKRRIK